MKRHLSQCLKNRDSDPDISYVSESDLVVPETETQAKKNQIGLFHCKKKWFFSSKIGFDSGKIFLCQQYSIQCCRTYNFPRLSVSVLRSGYYVASRKALACTLLDTVIAEVDKETRKVLKEKM